MGDTMRVRPWMVVVVEPKEEVHFFDDITKCLEFTMEHPLLKCILAVAVMKTGPRNGVG
jgi:hypothetical protein